MEGCRLGIRPTDACVSKGKRKTGDNFTHLVKLLEPLGVVLALLTFHPRIHLDDFDEVTGMKGMLSPYHLEKCH